METLKPSAYAFHDIYKSHLGLVNIEMFYRLSFTSLVGVVE